MYGECMTDSAIRVSGMRMEVTVTSHGRRRTRLTTSRNYPLGPDLEVVTQSARITDARKGVLELLLARAPESERIQSLAAQHGVTQPAYIEPEADGCIVCGLCVRTCATVIGDVLFFHRCGRFTAITTSRQPITIPTI